MYEYPHERDVVAPGVLHQGDFAIRQITEFRAYLHRRHGVTTTHAHAAVMLVRDGGDAADGERLRHNTNGTTSGHNP